jgi:hypothetical protein
VSVAVTEPLAVPIVVSARDELVAASFRLTDGVEVREPVS